jgi:hypothetical protein
MGFRPCNKFGSTRHITGKDDVVVKAALGVMIRHKAETMPNLPSFTPLRVPILCTCLWDGIACAVLGMEKGNPLSSLFLMDIHEMKMPTRMA